MINSLKTVSIQYPKKFNYLFLDFEIHYGMTQHKIPNSSKSSEKNGICPFREIPCQIFEIATFFISKVYAAELFLVDADYTCSSYIAMYLLHFQRIIYLLKIRTDFWKTKCYKTILTVTLTHVLT